MVFGGKADAVPGSVEDLRFDEGVRMGSWGLLLHSVTGEASFSSQVQIFQSCFILPTALLFSSCLQKRVISLIGLRATYLSGLVIFAVCMFLTVATGANVSALNFFAAVSGVGFAVITTIPNSLITMYHDNPDLFFKDRIRGESTKSSVSRVGLDIPSRNIYFIPLAPLNLQGDLLSHNNRKFQLSNWAPTLLKLPATGHKWVKER